MNANKNNKKSLEEIHNILLCSAANLKRQNSHQNLYPQAKFHNGNTEKQTIQNHIKTNTIYSVKRRHQKQFGYSQFLIHWTPCWIQVMWQGTRRDFDEILSLGHLSFCVSCLGSPLATENMKIKISRHIYCLNDRLIVYDAILM